MKQTTFQEKRTIFGGVLFLLLLASVADARRTRATAEVEAEPETTPLNRKQTVALHHAVKKLLGLKVSPHKLEEGSRGGGGHLGRKSNSLVGSPPQYMLDLYDKYKYGAIPHGRLTGNTVRYIDAEIGVVGGERVFVFNLSSVAPTERVFSADLHLYQRRTSKHADHLVALRKVTPKVISSVGSVPLRSRDKGWQAADVTSGVKRCISSNRKSAVTSSLAVSFRRKKGGKKSRVVPISRFSGETSLPFLVLFSNDTQNITLDHVDPHFRSADLLEEVVDPEFGYDPTLVDGKYQRKPVLEVDDLEYDEDYSEEEEESTEDDLDDIFTFDGFSEETEDEELEDTETEVKPTDRARPSPETEGQSVGRTRRSIHDNEIPETPGMRLPLKPPYNMPPPDGVTFTTRSKGPEGGHTVKVKDNKVKVDPTPGAEVKEDKEWTPPKSVTTSVSAPDDKKEPDADADLIPYPDEFVERRRKNRRRNRRRNRKHGRRRRPHHHERQLPLPPAWEAELRKENLTGGGDRKGLCGRRKLVVDFADIGWNDWIISPKSFEAHYCAGQCPFPLVKDVRPSNHATIQSLVHVIGIPADVPAPCCVPDELTAVSLLYFDGNKNVVLKHYPSMSVTSCACR